MFDTICRPSVEQPGGSTATMKAFPALVTSGPVVGTKPNLNVPSTAVLAVAMTPQVFSGLDGFPTYKRREAFETGAPPLVFARTDPAIDPVRPRSYAEKTGEKMKPWSVLDGLTSCG